MQRAFFSPDKLQTARVLMIAAILLIVAFQSYWVARLYREEKQGLRKEANNIFRDVVYNLQAEKFKGDSLFFRSTVGPNIFVRNFINDFRKSVRRRDTAKHRASGGGITLVMEEKNDSLSSGGGGISVRKAGMPREWEEMIRQQVGKGRKIIIHDSLSQQTSPKMGMGVSLTVSGDPEKADSLLRAMQRMVPAKRILFSPATGPRVADSVSRTVRVAPGANIHFRYSDTDMVRLITSGKVLDDSISVARLDSAYRKELAKGNIPLSFSIRTGKDDSLHRKDTVTAAVFATRPASVGFMKPLWYQAEFENPAAFLARKVSPQILFSLFLVAFTSVTFIFLYRNLAQQRRLTEMKNDFISNITHELKTPIATVSVAVEALRNFGGMQNPERTKEYLDISAAELQRLGLLVDKVLKLSLFENRELELKKENFDLHALLQEVLNTMRLQFEKHHAKLDVDIQGSYFTINADRLHITSVIYNLLDNALKYSPGKPEIKVLLKHDTDSVVLSVSDKGLGIPAAFREKIFDKFFRVPTGDHHNIKGYGLGLSYVAHVVNKHDGTIDVTSEEGKGSTFTVKLPIA